MFERFTGGARRVVVLAQEEARQRNHDVVDTEHFLIGLMLTDGWASEVLADHGLSVGDVREWVEKAHARGEQPRAGHIPFTPALKKVLEKALREALQLGHSYVGVEHLMLGLIRHGEGIAVEILAEAGIGLNALRRGIGERVADQQKAAAGAQRSERVKAVATHLAGLVRFAIPPAMWGDVVDTLRRQLLDEPDGSGPLDSSA